MANITPTVVNVPGDGSVYLVTWAAMQNGDIGLPVGGGDQFHDFVDRNVQLEGTLGAAGACTIEGSNSGNAYATLNDFNNNALVMNALAVKSVRETPRFTRPRITAGDGTTSLTVSLLLKIDNVMRT